MYGSRRSITRKKLQTAERSIKGYVKNPYGPLSNTLSLSITCHGCAQAVPSFQIRCSTHNDLTTARRSSASGAEHRATTKVVVPLNLGSGLSARMRDKRRLGFARGKFTAVETVWVRAETDSKGPIGPSKGRRA